MDTWSVEKTIEALSADAGIDEDVCKMILKKYVDQTYALIEEMENFIKQDGCSEEDLGRLIHKLKGSSANVRANHVTEVVYQLEEDFNRTILSCEELKEGLGKITYEMEQFEKILKL